MKKLLLSLIAIIPMIAFSQAHKTIMQLDSTDDAANGYLYMVKNGHDYRIPTSSFSTKTTDTTFDVLGAAIKNVADAVDLGDAANKRYVDETNSCDLTFKPLYDNISQLTSYDDSICICIKSGIYITNPGDNPIRFKDNTRYIFNNVWYWNKASGDYIDIGGTNKITATGTIYIDTIPDASTIIPNTDLPAENVYMQDLNIIIDGQKTYSIISITEPQTKNVNIQMSLLNCELQVGNKPFSIHTQHSYYKITLLNDTSAYSNAVIDIHGNGNTIELYCDSINKSIIDTLIHIYPDAYNTTVILTYSGQDTIIDEGQNSTIINAKYLASSSEEKTYKAGAFIDSAALARDTIKVDTTGMGIGQGGLQWSDTVPANGIATKDFTTNSIEDTTAEITNGTRNFTGFKFINRLFSTLKGSGTSIPTSIYVDSIAAAYIGKISAGENVTILGTPPDITIIGSGGTMSLSAGSNTTISNVGNSWTIGMSATPNFTTISTSSDISVGGSVKANIFIPLTGNDNTIGNGSGTVTIKGTTNITTTEATTPTHVYCHENASGNIKEIPLNTSGGAFYSSSQSFDLLFKANTIVSASLTDGTPTAAEVISAIGTAASLGSGVIRFIHDTSGTALMYFILSDGTYFYCWGGSCVGTKLL